MGACFRFELPVLRIDFDRDRVLCEVAMRGNAGHAAGAEIADWGEWAGV